MDRTRCPGYTDLGLPTSDNSDVGLEMTSDKNPTSGQIRPRTRNDLGQESDLGPDQISDPNGPRTKIQPRTRIRPRTENPTSDQIRPRTQIPTSDSNSTSDLELIFRPWTQIRVNDEKMKNIKKRLKNEKKNNNVNFFVM